MDEQLSSINVCAEYDHAATAVWTDEEGAAWRETPPRIHVWESTAADPVARHFLMTAYALTEGCRPGMLHGDLIAEED